VHRNMMLRRRMNFYGYQAFWHDTCKDSQRWISRFINRTMPYGPKDGS
jgi:hypothetical protein